MHDSQRNVNLYACLLSKLQRNVEITAMFCMHIRRDTPDWLNNKDMLKSLLKEMNNRIILDSFRCSYCMYLSFKKFGCS